MTRISELLQTVKHHTIPFRLQVYNGNRGGSTDRNRWGIDPYNSARIAQGWSGGESERNRGGSRGIGTVSGESGRDRGLQRESVESTDGNRGGIDPTTAQGWSGGGIGEESGESTDGDRGGNRGNRGNRPLRAKQQKHDQPRLSLRYAYVPISRFPPNFKNQWVKSWILEISIRLFLNWNKVSRREGTLTSNFGNSRKE